MNDTQNAEAPRGSERVKGVTTRTGSIAYLLAVFEDLEFVRHAAILVHGGYPATLLAHVLRQIHLAGLA